MSRGKGQDVRYRPHSRHERRLPEPVRAGPHPLDDEAMQMMDTIIAEQSESNPAVRQSWTDAMLKIMRDYSEYSDWARMLADTMERAIIDPDGGTMRLIQR